MINLTFSQIYMKMSKCVSNRRFIVYNFKADFKKGLLPNCITFVGVLMILPIILARRAGMFGSSLFYFVVAWFCDWADGHFARKFVMTSKIGTFLDPLTDKAFTWSILIDNWHRVPKEAAVIIMITGLLATIGRIIILIANRNPAVNIDIMAGMAGKYKTNFEKSGLVALLLADICGKYIHYEWLVDLFMFISKLGIWLSIPLAIISFLSIVMKLYKIYHEPA
ncbi:MAG: CDP-diacylglycerol-glycerol-3-phosphate 3-phosphatidyltransferase [Parcubacteria group bacterium GW2011_GWC2_39_14]|nr:MAG: CDP-diacylglycerol-glycerol-3-phosphate 3-phosphatidyltransferase [Parcubacteria group bacterium GW2011_GWC2_39_14]KKR54863.1 MAG: CDP-diacylglycerol-glycerol-3-phosphate 3-phosphatidyltransferase [Parcubacteria group bacterium GW2011_GWA2_40_23]